MAGLGLGHFKLGDFKIALRHTDAGVYAFRLLHPGVHIGWLNGLKHRRRCQAARLRALLADQLVKGDFFHAQVILGGNFLGQHQIKAGLRFTGVGDGGGAHFKVALGRSQLLGHGRFLRFHKVQAVLRGQRIKVSLAGAHNQLLLCGVQLCAGQRQLLLALIEGGPVAGPVQRVRGTEGGALGVERAYKA